MRRKSFWTLEKIKEANKCSLKKFRPNYLFASEVIRMRAANLKYQVFLGSNFDIARDKVRRTGRKKRKYIGITDREVIFLAENCLTKNDFWKNTRVSKCIYRRPELRQKVKEIFQRRFLFLEFDKKKWTAKEILDFVYLVNSRNEFWEKLPKLSQKHEKELKDKIRKIFDEREKNEPGFKKKYDNGSRRKTTRLSKQIIKR